MAKSTILNSQRRGKILVVTDVALSMCGDCKMNKTHCGKAIYEMVRLHNHEKQQFMNFLSKVELAF